MDSSKVGATCAFFDVDQTIWYEKSVISFWEFYLRKFKKDSFSDCLEEFYGWVKLLVSKGVSRSEMNRRFYNKYFSGVSVADIEFASNMWSEENYSKDGFWISEILRKVGEHKDKGHRIILVSGSFSEVLNPLAEKLGAEDVLCAKIESDNGIYTGRVIDDPMIGYGKTKAVMNYLIQREISAENCFGYGDDASDVSFIGVLGYPNLVVHPANKDMNTLANILNYNAINIGKLN